MEQRWARTTDDRWEHTGEAGASVELALKEDTMAKALVFPHTKLVQALVHTIEGLVLVRTLVWVMV